MFRRREEDIDPWQKYAGQDTPRSLTHQARAPLDAKEKEDGPSTATVTTVASSGMRGGTAHVWMKLAKRRLLNVRASIPRAVTRGQWDERILACCGQVGVVERLDKGSRYVLGPNARTECDSASRRGWMRWAIGARKYGISLGFKFWRQYLPKLNMLCSITKPTVGCGSSMAACDCTKQVRGVFA